MPEKQENGSHDGFTTPSATFAPKQPSPRRPRFYKNSSIYTAAGSEVRVQILRLGEQVEAASCTLPADAVSYWRQHITKTSWYDPEKEMCVVLCLNVRDRITSFALVSLGCLTETIVLPREVFRPAIALGAHSIILMHNHPSGDPSASTQDIRVTRRLADAAHILQIKVADHIIVGAGDRYYSFREAGRL